MILNISAKRLLKTQQLDLKQTQRFMKIGSIQTKPGCARLVGPTIILSNSSYGLLVAMMGSNKVLSDTNFLLILIWSNYKLVL